ncbi:MAG: hypothetical protein ABEJ31_07055 [Haloarculaceae archaeon]
MEQERSGGKYHIIVTDGEASLDGGAEKSQVQALARGKYIADECGLDAIFKYAGTESIWILDEFINAHPSVRQDVHERLRRLPENTSDGFLDRIRNIL